MGEQREREDNFTRLLRGLSVFCGVVTSLYLSLLGLKVAMRTRLVSNS